MTTKEKIVLLILFLLLVCLSPVWSTEEYAVQTGKECTFCHVNPNEGTELNGNGLEFLTGLEKKGLVRKTSGSIRTVRFILIYIHVITAFIWFGSIFYIHIFLKPAYVTKGIPKGELKLGWASMLTMLLTGTVLTWMKIPAFSSFFKTRFGVYLFIKIILFVLLVFIVIFVTLYISPKLKKKIRSSGIVVEGNKTHGELEGFDGKDGRPAYVAYAGKIYDVSHSPLWKNGQHLKIHLAGTDLTRAMKNAPHGDEVFKTFAQTGEVKKDEKKRVTPFYLRFFHFLIYFVLAVIFMIIFIISFWKK